MKSSMASSCLAALLLIAALIAISDPLIVGCVNAQIDTPVTAMFVFGDSYADTGNDNECSPSRKPPYGQTWPGYPAGRFSDGKILTDYIASIINIETPAPHRNRSSGLGCNNFTSGINFAHGGTGIFTTYFAPEGPTLSCQIDQLQMFSISCPDYIESLIDSSVALVVMVGNDYITYIEEHPDWRDLVGLFEFIPSVVTGIIDSIIRLYNIGFRKFAIANLEPTGCIPRFSTDNYTSCNEIVNLFSKLHNKLLSEGINEIQTELSEMSISILDQSESFHKAQEGKTLEACVNSTTNIVCPDPENYFFWDGIHPTQAGWKAVTDMYEDQIQELIGTYNGKSLRFN